MEVASPERTRCKVQRVRADKLEDAVLQSLGEMLVRGKYFDSLGDRITHVAEDNVKDLERNCTRVKKELSDIEFKIEQAFALSSGITEGDAVALIRERLEKLAQEKKNFLSY